MRVIVERFNDMGTLRFQLTGSVGIVTMNRARQRNALTQQMWRTIGEWVGNLPAKTRVLVVRGAGNDFTSGSDISEFSTLSLEQANEAFDTMEETMRQIEKLSIPTIASINGPAFGAGFILAMACDIRIGTERASFGMPVGKLGITLQEPFLRRMVQMLGVSRTMDLVYTARTYNVDEAMEVGLLNYLTSSKDIDSETMTLCRRILMQSPASLRAVKHNLQSLVKVAASAQGDWVDSADFAEGVQAFAEKRSAQF